jgi:hypothetical protein
MGAAMNPSEIVIDCQPLYVIPLCPESWPRYRPLFGLGYWGAEWLVPGESLGVWWMGRN